MYGHRWLVLPKSISTGHWCPVCDGRDVDTAEKEFINIVTNRGGKIHGKYINCKTKVEIECNLGHHWFTTPGTIKENHWCPICSHSIEGAKQGFELTVHLRQGKILDQYIDTDTDVYL